MPRYALTVALPLALLLGCRSGTSVESEPLTTPYQPAVHLEELFVAVQTGHLFADSKTFVDCRPKFHPDLIKQAYLYQKNRPDFNLKLFVDEHFHLPELVDATYESDVSLSLEDHLQNHWPYLTRPADDAYAYSSLIALPYSYVVPGGRFREIYYWDSYFTMQGLAVSGRMDLVEDMLNNFAWLIQEVGHIPNGNRTYYLSRSQPPYFGAMVALYQQEKGTAAAVRYLSSLEKEYEFWMDGRDKVSAEHPAYRRLVQLADGSHLNRYYDDLDTPRPESFSEDVEVATRLPEAERPQLYRNLRAAAESGWDFSSRWMSRPPDLASTHTTDILPIDLNCLLLRTEELLSELHCAQGNTDISNAYESKAETRRQTLQKWLWDEQAGWYRDYDWRQAAFTPSENLAAATALYVGLPTDEQAVRMESYIKAKFLAEGGVVTTVQPSDQQWDYPNGWAPLQWLTIQGLRNYDLPLVADEICSRWLRLNRRVYHQTGRMMEKYNVLDTTLVAGGGEYPLQDGFGWTNGVALALILRKD